MTDFQTLQQRHDQRTRAPEAALGVPNVDFCDPYGPLLVPYLSPSWREIRLVQALGDMNAQQQEQVCFLLIARRLPALTFDEFDNLTSPEHFAPWWRATRAPAPPAGEGGGDDPPSTGRVPSRPSPYSHLTATGTTRR